MADQDIIKDSISKLVCYIENNDYKGYDPYDALKSPLFSIPILRDNKFIRFGTQQFVKRFPLNLRPLLRIPKGYNPVTLGLCIQGYAYLLKTSGYSSSLHLPISSAQNKYLQQIHFLIRELKNMIPAGYHGACWGYDFDWQARHASIPSLQPTVVATGIITNALYEAYAITGIGECAELVKSSALFVLNDLNKTYHNESLIFSYSPFDRQQVFNASMKGARILAQAWSLSKNDQYLELAGKAVKFVASKQQDDGSWEYSLAAEGGWKDNYHTGYILDCMHEFIRISGQNNLNVSMHSGYRFYLGNFFEKTGMPRFYAGRKYPADCTAGAQSILTLKRFGDHNMARQTAMWMISEMQAGNGSFFYRKYKNYTNRTAFMRWSNAWMFAAMAYLISDFGLTISD